ncbi:MAG TPA: 50S ribosomal protein L9 [Steroidobacteraceae bacterium]|nr:50S ribosomal protein L9 [Steroidobacteraceae bacterium]
MDIILLQKVANLGQIGDRVKVKPGYARNYLVPTGRATMATPANIAKFEAQRHELEAKAHEELTAAQGRAAQLQNFKLELKAKAGTEGKLFGSIGTADIAEAAVKAGHPVSRSEVRMPNGPIRSTGEHQVQVHLHADVDVTVTVTIVAEE